MSNKILITGASGGLGGGVLEHLLQHVPAERVVALTRDAKKVERFSAQGVEVRLADFDDAAALQQAFTGIHTVYIVPTAALNRVEQHQRVVDIAAQQGVQHIVYSGVIHHDEAGQGAIVSDHQATERHIAASGVPYTFVRNSIYLDVLPMILAGAAATGAFAYPNAANGVSLAARADMAEATARIIADPALQGKPQTLSLPKPVFYADLAKSYGELIAKPVQYTAVSVDEHVAQLIAAGTPAPIAGFLGGMAKGLADGVILQADDNLKNLLGREPIGVAEFLRTLPKNG